MGIMMGCAVLRCSNVTAHTVNVMPPDCVPIEVRLCEEHDAAIRAGQPWFYDDDERAVLMRKDLVTSGMQLIAKFTTFGEDRGTAGRNSMALHGEYEDGTPFKLLLSTQSLTWLRSMFEKFPDIGAR
jgi:hypothetical protein